MIELLVVIAIISLLVSILLPSLQRAKDLANAVVCLNNLRGVGMAFHLHAEDNAGLLPPCAAAEGTPWMTIWDRLIQKYTGAEIPAVPNPTDPRDTARDIFACPADGYVRPYGRARSYSMLFFNYYDGSGGNIDYLERMPIDRFPKPAESFLSTEWHTNNNIRLVNGPPCIMFYWYYLTGDPYTPGPAPADGNYHGKGNGFLFVDAHAEVLSRGQAYTGDPTVYWNWGL